MNSEQARKAIEDAVNDKDEAWRARMARQNHEDTMTLVIVGVAFFVLGVLAGVTWFGLAAWIGR